MKHRTIIAILSSLLAALVVILLHFLPFSERFDLGILNVWFSIRGKVAPPNDMVVIAMDEQSYRDLEVPLNQPWPRALHAKLVNRLADLGAKRVVFDILFLDAGGDPVADEQFTQALSRIPVFLGVESAVQQVGGSNGSYALEELLEPYAPFGKAAAGLGLVGLPETDGAVRGFFTDRSEVTSSYSTLAEVGAGYEVGDKNIRPSNRDFINYFGPARSLQTLSYYQVLQTERPIPAQMLRDKIVYVGLALRTDTGPAQKDIFATSFGGSRVFGTEIHATAAANLMRGDWIMRASNSFELISTIAFAAIISFLILSNSPLVGGCLLLGLIVLWGVVAYLAFASHIFVPGGMVAIVLLPIVYSFNTVYRYFTTQRSAKQMRSAFDLYLSPEMTAQLAQSDSAAALGGSKIWASALFTDIADFTNITEEMPAEKVAEMLNAYFTEVMEVVFQNKGTLIKFIGDAVFVLWGAPLKIDNHAELAIKTGLAINKEVERFNASGRFPPLKTRVGINTGPMVVGNLGSKRRFDYTAIGDSVNLASRAEGLNKYFGTLLLFTESTRKEGATSIPGVLSVGRVRVVGKKEAVALFTTFDPPVGAGIPALMDTALDLFRKQRWTEAMTTLAEIEAKESRLAGVIALYRGMIKGFESTPPSQGWSGEVDFAHK